MGDQPDRTHQNFDCVSNRFVVVDYGNYWSAIRHLARPVTARHLLRNNGCRPRDSFLVQPRRNRYMLRLYDCIETQRLASEAELLCTWSKLRHRHRPSFHPRLLAQKEAPPASHWRGKGRPQGVIGLEGGDLHHNGTHWRSLLISRKDRVPDRNMRRIRRLCAAGQPVRFWRAAGT